MPKAARIDSVTQDAQGQLVVQYTSGRGVLGAPAGSAVVFPDKEALRQAMEDLEEEITDERLVLLALSVWYKGDSQMRTLSAAAGRTAALDLTGTATTVRVA